jgi:methylglutaconyl-CoA hydratase
MDTLLQSVSDRGIATLTFNRPDKANSFDAAMLDALTDGFERYGNDPAVRAIVLRGSGKHFSAGAAIGAEGQAKRSMGEACALIDNVPKPTIAVVQGACIGGALALASCCDMMVASRAAMFSIPEVRLGFAPGPLIGFFARAMGARALRRYLYSGERFSAEEALRIGLVHELVEAEALDRTLDAILDQILLGAPGAIARAKAVLQDQGAPPALSAAELREMQAAFHAVAQSAEAAEGRAAFQEKRKPAWYPPRRDA